MRLPTVQRSVRENERPSLHSFMDDFMKNAFCEQRDEERLMAMDVVENGNEFILKANLPGIKKEDIKVFVDKGDLIIEAKRSQKKEAEDETLYRCERYCGNYRRVFSIPDTWDYTKIKAHYEDGVLTLNVPKQKPVPEKEIKIV